MTEPVAVDTSVAIPLLVETHAGHALVTGWWSGREVALGGHALAETYSVLTRLPGDLRVAPTDAVSLIEQRFAEPLLLSPDTAARVPRVLAERGVAGGAVYDALVALVAVQHGMPLATRDARAKTTYETVGAAVEVVA